MSIGERIRKYRNNKGWTQLQLARRAEITATSVSLYENDRALPTIDSLWALADAFGCSMDELVGRRMPNESRRA